MQDKLYRGFYDDGHDYGEIDYYSTYRNYSKKNMDDLKKALIKKMGFTRYSQLVKIDFGYLIGGIKKWN